MAPEYNPIEWGRSAARGVGSLFGESTPDAQPPVEPPAAEGRPYPNLATVPRPPKLTPRAERDAELVRLQADQTAAADADRRLREAGTFPVAAPAPAVAETPAAPAPMSPPAAPAPPPGAAPLAPALTASPAPSAPVAQAQPPAGGVLQRVGSVGFARDASTLTEAGQGVLADAAGLARANNGRVRLIPAQIARHVPPAELSRARSEAILQALGRAGLARDRVRIDDGAGRRVDLYDLYVEY